MKGMITGSLNESLDLHGKCLEMAPVIEEAAGLIWNSLSSGGKLIILGNGGSAADAQHIAAEMVGRFEMNHTPIPALALTTNSSIITAVSNDFGFDEVFYRQMVSLLKAEDVVLAISTSGNSGNINIAVKYAREKGASVVGLSGKDGGELRGICEVCMVVPFNRTCRIQEIHILIGHILCEVIENMWVDSKLDS